MDKFFNSRYATEVDVDFVRKSVRAIGRCAIKVEVCCKLNGQHSKCLGWSHENWVSSMSR